MRQRKQNYMALLLAFAAGSSPIASFAQSSGLETHFAPLTVPREFFNGIHVAKDDPKAQMEADHYCSALKSGMFQCVLFSSTAADAKLMGIEYIVTGDVYRALPEEEKKFWHPHPYEVLGGGLIAPDMTPAAEQKFMRGLMDTWGKTFHTWGDHMTDIPLGAPRLMWALTGPGQVDQTLVERRDQFFHVSTSQISERRKREIGYEEPHVAPPQSVDTVGRRWTDEGQDKPTPRKIQ